MTVKLVIVFMVVLAVFHVQKKLNLQQSTL